MNNENQNAVLQPMPAAPAQFNFFDPVQFETMQRVCKLFASSELVPDMYKAKLESIPASATEEQKAAIQARNKEAWNKATSNCMIAIEMAQRIGASPLMIMQNMIIIYGRPTWSSKFLIATVNTCGRFNPLQYRFTEKGMLGNVEYTEYEKVWDKTANGGRGGYRNNAKSVVFDGKKVMDIECVAFTTKRGSEEILESSPISLRLAIMEGWYTKSGSKWRTIPRQMLMYRAASFWTNAYAPEISMGMKTEEEIRDIIDIDHEDVTELVNREKAENANRATIGFAPEQTIQSNESGMMVDTETGEIKEESKKQDKPEEPIQQQRKMPGF